MWEKFVEAGTGVHIIWGIGGLGLLLHFMFSLFMNSMIRASRDMSTTRKKGLSVIRRKYDNRKALCTQSGYNQNFVQKNLYELKLLGIPLTKWENISKFLCTTCLAACSFAFLYYDDAWRQSPNMVYFIANASLVCAFLLLLENIFLPRRKMELLRANIGDFFEFSRITDNVPQTQSAPKPTEEKEIIQQREDNNISEEAAPCDEEVLNSFLKEFFA